MSKSKEIKKYFTEKTNHTKESINKLIDDGEIVYGDFINTDIFKKSNTKMPKSGILIIEEKELVFYGAKSILEKEVFVSFPFENLRLTSHPAFTINFIFEQPDKPSDKCKFSFSWEDYISKNIKPQFLASLEKKIKFSLEKKTTKLLKQKNIDNTEIYFYFNKLVKNKIYNKKLIQGYLSLAKREILNAYDYLNQSKNYFYNDNNSNKSILYLISAESSIHKAKGFFTIANEKNQETTTILNFSIKMDIVEKVSERWISYVESTIDYYEAIGYNNTLEYPKQILYQAINYNSEGLFYIAMMNVAYAKALLEYYTQAYPMYYDYSQTLSSCKTYLDLAKLTMNLVYNNSDVDAPLAKSIIEQAELHSQDAENKGIESSAITIAMISIQESLIARGQAFAALDLKNAIGYEISENNLANEKPLSQTNHLEIQYIMLSIIVIESLLIVILWFKKNKNH